MNPVSDLVCNLLQTPFRYWKDEDRKDLLNTDLPHPVLSVEKFVISRRKRRIRKFKPSWYLQHKWLCGSSYLQRLYCWPCLLLGTAKRAWNSCGVEDIINGPRSFKKHASSIEHLKNSAALKEIELNMNKSANVQKECSRLNTMKHNEKVRLNRLFMHYPIRAMLYLLTQETCFSERNECENSFNRGRFKELMDSYVEGSPSEIQQHYSELQSMFSGNCKTIQEEIIDCISNHIKCHIEEEIKRSVCFSVQINDLSDIQKSQLCFNLRFVNSSGVLTERFYGLHDFSTNCTPDALFEVLDTKLSQLDYRNKLIAQCYDGSSVMAGQLSSFQNRVKEVATQAICVHSLSQGLNLVLRQILKKISKCRIFFATISGMASFLNHSAVRTYMLNSEVGKRIPSPTDARWSSLSCFLNIVVNEWDELKSVLQSILYDEDREIYIRQAKAYLNEFYDAEFAFLVLLFKDIFQLTHILFSILQKFSFDIAYCIDMINVTMRTLAEKCNDNTFEMIYQASLQKADILKQKRDLSQNDHVCSMKNLFSEILETVMTELSDRFPDLNKLKFVELANTSKFPEFWRRGFPIEALSSLQSSYPIIFPDTVKLKNELHLIYKSEKYHNKNLELVVKSLKETQLDEVFTETYKLFSLILSIPSISSYAERSVSCLKRVKTYLRNRIANKGQSSLPFILIHHEILTNLMKTQPFYEDIIDALEISEIDLKYKY